MSLKNVIAFPHRSGRCRKCLTPECRDRVVLCLSCERFANQDWVRQRGGIVSPEMALRITDEAAARKFWLPERAEEDDSCTTEEFERYLKTTPLSRQQRRIVYLLTIEGRTNDEMAKILRITPGSVRSQRQRIIEKFRFCQSPAILCRGKSETLIPDTPSSEPENIGNGKPGQEAGVVPTRLLRRFCPRCYERLFIADQDFQYCMNCSWNSDEYA